MEDIKLKQAIVGDRHFGFLGAGKMSQAIIKGLLTSGLLKGSQVTMTDIVTPAQPQFYKHIENLHKEFGVEYLLENPPMAKKSDVIFVCVKPNLVDTVLRECKDVIKDKLVISIAAGVTIGDLEAALPSGTHVIRVMPNTPCLVQQGAGIFSRGTNATEADVTLLRAVTSVIFPVMEEISEAQFNAATALSGSGPAYILMVIEGMADGGVRLGLTRDMAQRLAIQTVLGTAVLARQCAVHPAQLREEVCSPGGSTIAGTHVLEKAAVRAAFSDCIEAAKIRNDQLAPPKK
uniref:Pyrroline-5-carboxylate reductase n=1 Tax=Mesocestoides corti TaxID=53468 RepID=A0A5K3ER13_MESCO